MAPSALRRKTLSELRKTLLAMMSPEFDRALEGRPAAELTRAARTLLAVQRARLRLANTELAAIRDELKANEAALLEGMKRVEKAREHLRRVTAVVEAATAFVRTVARIVELAV